MLYQLKNLNTRSQISVLRLKKMPSKYLCSLRRRGTKRQKKTYSQHTKNKKKNKKKHQYSDNNLVLCKSKAYICVWCVWIEWQSRMSEWETFSRKKTRHVIDDAVYLRWMFSFQCPSIWIVHWIRSCYVYLYGLAFLHLYLCFCCRCTSFSSAHVLVCQMYDGNVNKM